MAIEQEVGKISHYYDKAGVGIIELTDTLKVGDTIHIKGHTTDFTQQITSLQVEHQQIEEAKAGDSIGVKVDQLVREHDKAYKVTE